MAEGGASSINDTSKPRGNYLDPLKACALSGESDVPFGKSESATFAKFSSISRQIKRNASRASVLNDVEKSRYDSVVKRIDGEKEYHISVLDRQFRQLQRSLTKIEKQRRTIPKYSKEFASTDAFRKYMGLPRMNKRTSELQGGLNLPPISDFKEPLKTIEEIEMEAKEREERERLKREQEMQLLADDLPDFPARRVQSLPVLDRPGFITQGMPQLPNRFYGGGNDASGNEATDVHQTEYERLPSI